MILFKDVECLLAPRGNAPFDEGARRRALLLQMILILSTAISIRRRRGHYFLREFLPLIFISAPRGVPHGLTKPPHRAKHVSPRSSNFRKKERKKETHPPLVPL